MTHQPPRPRLHRRRPARRALRGHAGVTLMEILVVLVIMALLVGGVAFGFGAVPRTRLRTSAVRLSVAFRAAYIHALTTGKTTRVSFALGTGNLSLEDTDDAHTLDRDDPLHAGGAADVEQAAATEARMMSDLRPRATRASFTALPLNVFRPRPLEDQVVITRLYSPHDPEPREQGTGHVYFFSGGVTERAVVQLRNSTGDVYTVALSPLTGRTEVYDRAIEPQTYDDSDVNDDREIDNRERGLDEGSR